MTNVIKQLNRKIAARNRAFARMTAAGKRVAIAKDVLAQLSGGKLRATHGTYFDVGKSKYGKLAAGTGKDLSELLPELGTCNVCAVGALFTCAVGFADKLKVAHVDDLADVDGHANGNSIVLRTAVDGERWINTDTYGYLAKFFTERQLQNMESAFENDGGAIDGEWVRYGLPANPRKRIEAIMRNVVQNKGSFVPEKLYRQFAGKKAGRASAAA